MNPNRKTRNNECQHLAKNGENIGICSAIPDCNTFIANVTPGSVCPEWAKTITKENDALKTELRKETKECTNPQVQKTTSTILLS
jgi:hypothetical protein